MKPGELPRAFLQHWGVLLGVKELSRIDGGEMKDVFRVTTADASYALRIYPADVSTEDVASELEITAHFAERLPEVPTALPTKSGTLEAVANGRTAVLTTFIPGRTVDSGDHRHRRAAAEMLARLHQVAARVGVHPARAGYPAWRDLDWRENRWWSWPNITRFLEESDPEGFQDVDSAQMLRRLTDEISELPGRLEALSMLGLPLMPIHNDFCPLNLIEQDGRIVGVIDWDECTIDWRALELANAACEFSRGDNHHSVVPDWLRAFLEDYVGAGGEILDQERDALLRLRRLRLLWEALYEIGRACRGLRCDGLYNWENLISLDDVSDKLI